MKILIAGGGIGGLVTALSLHELGYDIRVYESVKEIRALGVGINLLPHSMRILTNLGLLKAIEKVAVETQELVYSNRHGQVFWEERRGRFGGYQWPQFSIHRGDLQMLLYKEVVDRLGANKVLTGHHFEQFVQSENEVTATFIDESSGMSICRDTGDVLIGADGIHSVTRKQLYPKEGEVKYSGNVLYRGTTMMKPFMTEASMVMIGSNTQKMVAYPIKSTQADGLQLINWISNLKESEDHQIKTRDWHRQADRTRLKTLYKDWLFDWLDVPKMINEADKIFEFPMSDRDPLDRWTFGRVTLMGDAAHPMYPIGSNGASQAILDAECLALQLKTYDDPREGLKAYEALRLPATRDVVLRNRKKGPDVMLDLMEKRFPAGFSPDQIPHEELNEIMDSYKKLAGFDKHSLNQLS